MNKKLLQLVLVICMGLFSSAKADAKVIARGNNDFGINLYRQVAAEPKQGNILVSPYSIYAALAVAYAGSNGNTKAEFEKVMGIKDASSYHETLAETINSLNRRDGKGFSISIANALWIEEHAKILESYTALTKKYYSAAENKIDASKPEESADKINKWVAEKTQDKITNLLSAKNISPATKLIITNAIYFKGTWQTPFEKEATSEQNFTPLSGSPQKTPMMHMQKHFYYANSGGFKILELPYKSENSGYLSMLLILPDKAGEAALKALEAKLSDKLLQEFDANKKTPEVNVSLPKFKIETPALELGDQLQALGIKDAFIYPAADFSGITGDREFIISEVLHKAIIDVNEQGTEAAAATALIMPTGAAFNPNPPEQFTADRPFIYLIRDNKTGLILFIGKLITPVTK